MSNFYESMSCYACHDRQCITGFLVCKRCLMIMDGINPFDCNWRNGVCGADDVAYGKCPRNAVSEGGVCEKHYK